MQVVQLFLTKNTHCLLGDQFSSTCRNKCMFSVQGPEGLEGTVCPTLSGSCKDHLRKKKYIKLVPVFAQTVSELFHHRGKISCNVTPSYGPPSFHVKSSVFYMSHVINMIQKHHLVKSAVKHQ